MHAYQKGPMIGEGTYGSVICATHKATGRQVAIKKVRLGSSSGKEGVNMSVLRELKALRSLAAPCVVDLLDTFSTKSSLVLVFEFMEWSLEDVIRDKNKALSEADVKSFMQMVLQALAHVHSLQAIHRDIKPDNLLISSDGHLKLADFGLARFLSCPTDSPADTPGKLTPQVFGRWYRPPELLMGSTNYSYGVDMWAAGCVFAELLLRRPWFPGNCDMDQLDRIFKMLGVPTPEVWPGYANLPHRIDFKPASGQPLQQVFQQASPEALDLLKRLMAFDPDRRISASDALAHPYFSAHPQPTPPAQLPKPAATRLNRLGLSRVPAVIPDMLMPHRLLQQQQQGFAVAGVAAAGWADAGEAGEALLMQQQRQQDAVQAAANGRSGLGARADAADAATGAARAGQLGGGTSRLLAFSDAPSFSGRFLGHGLLPVEQQHQQALQQQADGQPAGRHTQQGGQRHSVHFAADVADGDCEQEVSWKGRLSFSGILDEPTPPAGHISNPAAREGDAAPSAEAAGDENALPAGQPTAAQLHQQQLQHHVNRRASPNSSQAQKGAAGGHQQQTSSSSLRPPLHPNATPVHSRAGQQAQGAAIGSGDDRASHQQGGSRQRRGVSDLSAALSNAVPGSTAGLGGAAGLLNPLAPLLGMQRGVDQQHVQASILDSLAQQAAAGMAGTMPAHASTPAGAAGFAGAGAGQNGVGATEGDTACPMSLNTSARKRTRTVFEAAPAGMGGAGFVADQQQQGQDGGDVSMGGSHERRVMRSRRSSIHSGCCSMETDSMYGAAGAAQGAQHQQQEGNGLGMDDRSMSITSNALHAAMAGAQQQQQHPPQHMQHEQHMQQQQRDQQQTAEMPPPHAVQPRAATAAGHGAGSRATVAAAAAASDAPDPATSSKGVFGSGGSTCPMSLDHRNTTGQHHNHLQQHAPRPGSSGQQQRQPSSGGAEGAGGLNSGDLVTGGRPADELRSMDPAELAELAKFWRPRLDSAERRYLRCRTMQLGEALEQASQPDDDELGPEYHRFPGMDSSPSGCRGLFDTPAKGHTPCAQAGQHQQHQQHHLEPPQQHHGSGNSGVSLLPDSFLSPPGVSEQQGLPAGAAGGAAAGQGAVQPAGGPSGLLPAQAQLHEHDRQDPAGSGAPAAAAFLAAAR